MDPLFRDYPHNSPYAFSENRVIDAIELEGLEKLSFKVHMSMSSGNPALGVSTFVTDWYEDKAESKVNAFGRGLGKGAQNAAPIQITSEGNVKKEIHIVEDVAGIFKSIKELPGKLSEIPENLHNAGVGYVNTINNGSTEDKIESTTAILGTVLAAAKGKGSSSIGNVAKAGFNAKTGVVTFINRIKEIKIEVKLPDGFEKVTVQGSKAEVFKMKGKKEWISPDLDSHNGGIWKKASGKAENLFKKETRDGSYNADLSEKIGG